MEDHDWEVPDPWEERTDLHTFALFYSPVCRELLVNNEVFHRMLTEGVKVDHQQDGNTRDDRVWLSRGTNERL